MLETPLPRTNDAAELIVRSENDPDPVAPERLRPPASTYRVQLHAGFGFDQAAEIVPYLHALGIDAFYASPHFQSAPGSTHGYDVVDPTQLNAELGDAASYHRLQAALADHRMGFVIDIVPNHMGIANGANRYWQDVLENGRTSAYADFFDIDWEPVKPELRGKVLLPVLGDQYGVVLERGELRLEAADGRFRVCYYDLPLPMTPTSYPLILNEVLERVAGQFEPDDLQLLELQSLIATFERLPSNEQDDPEAVSERRREQTVAMHRLALLLQESARLQVAVDEVVAELNGDPANPASFDRLDALLDRQSYRLAFWRVASDEINYRRFFAIDSLAGVRQEVPEVFEETHRLLLELIEQGLVTGVRVDHPDGLWDPAGYLTQLQEAAARVLGPAAGPLYLTVEKILEPGETLRQSWPVSGTVGYEFARIVTGLFVDGSSEKQFDQWYRRFTGDLSSFDETVYEAKRLILTNALNSELNVLATVLNRLSERRRRTRDFTLGRLRFALREIIAAFPIYRTYVAGDGVLDPRDRRAIEEAVTRAMRRNAASDPLVFRFVRDLLIGNDDSHTEEDERERIRFVMRFQQLTGPVMAKGVEDTAFYRYLRLTTLNEVGGDPAVFGCSIEDAHRQLRSQAAEWPAGMLASTTHDTKRSEDTRARMVTISEYPREWGAATNRWSRLTRRNRSRVRGMRAPAPRDEALFYQTLVGVWPFHRNGIDQELADRVAAYMQKAAREAQLQTSWVNPDEEYEAALDCFVRRSLDPDASPEFIADFSSVHEEFALAGALTSLSMQTLKLTAPGVADCYQGTELWDFSLVDPDNRRAVDFSERAKLLEALNAGRASIDELVAGFDTGQIKLFLTARLLALRNDAYGLFLHGSYEPVTVTGDRSDHLFAFLRRNGPDALLVVVPRLLRRLLRTGDGSSLANASWGTTALRLPADLEQTSWRHCLTGEAFALDVDAPVAVAPLFARFPVVVLRGARGEEETA